MSTPTPLSPEATLQLEIETLKNANAFMATGNIPKDVQILFQKLLDDKCNMLRDQQATELLNQVFNANPIKVKEILASKIFASIPSAKESKRNAETKMIEESRECIVLSRVSGKEEYFSKRDQKMVCKREWKKISPLEAAAWAGDNFLVRELLKSIPTSLYRLAAEQLKGIRDRKDSEEHGGYLAPFKTLSKAYTACNKCRGLDPKLPQLWLEIGDRQRLLPTYGLQEFCEKRAHDPLPDFKQEPNRSIHLAPSHELDLDKLGSKYTLFKDWLWHRIDVQTIDGINGMRGAASVVDAAAIDHLCNVRTYELNNIIEGLLRHAPEQRQYDLDKPEPGDGKTSDSTDSKRKP